MVDREAEEAAAIERFIEEGGVKRLPPSKRRLRDDEVARAARFEEFRPRRRAAVIGIT
jgi:hypothetical protein